MARVQGAQAQLGLAFETVYGESPSSGFTRIPFASSTLGAAQPLLANELLGYGRDPLAPTKDAITADGDVVVPVDVEAFGFWLKGALGQPETSGGVHVFRSGKWGLPSMSIEVGLPQVPHFAMCKGCKVNQLSWTMQRSGLLTATARLVAQGEILSPTSEAGVLQPVELQRFGHFNGSIMRDGTFLANVVSCELTYANNLDPVEVIRPDGMIDGADEGIAAMTGRMTVRFDSQVMLQQAISGASCALSFAYTLPTGEALTISVPRVFLPRPKTQIEGPAGVQVVFDWQAAQTVDGSAMVTVELANSVEAY